ncbi:Hypothetical predicted protein, partial [Pelobates cultripes]
MRRAWSETWKPSMRQAYTHLTGTAVWELNPLQTLTDAVFHVIDHRLCQRAGAYSPPPVESLQWATVRRAPYYT